MGGLGCGINDADLASRVLDCLPCGPTQMPSEMAGIERTDCGLSDTSHGDDKIVLIDLKRLDNDCKNHCISIDMVTRSLSK